MQPVSTRLPLNPMLLVVLAAAFATHAEAQPAAAGHEEPTTKGRAVVPLVEARPENSQFGGLFRDRVGPPLSNSRSLEVKQTLQGGGRDSVLNGVLIGAGIGALLGLIPDHYDDCEECHDSLYGSIALGSGIGLLVDLLRNKKQPPAPSHKEDGLRLGVAVSRGAVGFGGRIAWR